MSASFPTSIRSLAVPSAGQGIKFSDVADMSEEVTAMLTAFVNGRARCSAFHSTTQSVVTATATALNLDSEDFDVGTMHDLVTNNSRVTIPASNAGIYLVLGATTFAGNATSFRQLELRKNGTTVLATATMPTNVAGVGTVIQVACFASLAAADYMELIATQSSGGNLNVGSATRGLASFLQVVRIW